ncbi:MAG: ammonia-forming cytochrome c nitrite reductase [Candidatus Cyclobacteriaceae bacterium M3_2C_046]
MATLREIIRRKPWIGWVLFIFTAVIIFFLGLLASSIMERRTEALYLDQRQIEIKPLEPRNSVWGINYPRQYQSYLETADTTFDSKYNGSNDEDVLETHPEMVVLWAGYLFAADYTTARGHYYAVQDVRRTLRTGAPMAPDQGPQPATCWTCKSPDVPRLMAEIGIKEFYAPKWADHGPEIVNYIGCADCHDEETMNLTITRPALIEAFARRGLDVTEASHQQMRNLVCAQCHVEYYFNKETPYEGVPYLTFPWDNGLDLVAMEEYYDELEFADWTHKLSQAPMLKAQHPDYELFLTGIHAKRGVTCADCHMPYRSEGGVKFTDHHIQSPLNNVSTSCQVCHRESEEELISNVYSNQDKVNSARRIAEDLLAKAHIEAAFAWESGATEEQMEDILMDIRHAQWRWDFSVASHGAAAHAPTECLQLLSTSINLAQEARLKLSRLLATMGYTEPVPMPDISTKEKAQAFIGLPMDEMIDEKLQFLHEVVPEWIETAQQRESQWVQYEGVSTEAEQMDY